MACAQWAIRWPQNHDGADHGGCHSHTQLPGALQWTRCCPVKSRRAQLSDSLWDACRSRKARRGSRSLDRAKQIDSSKMDLSIQAFAMEWDLHDAGPVTVADTPVQAVLPCSATGIISATHVTATSSPSFSTVHPTSFPVRHSKPGSMIAASLPEKARVSARSPTRGSLRAFVQTTATFTPQPLSQPSEPLPPRRIVPSRGL